MTKAISLPNITNRKHIMKKHILTLGLLISGNALATEQCYDIIPDGPTQELNTPTISMLGSGDIYANGVMQAEIKVDYQALSGFSFESVTLCDIYSGDPIQLDHQWEVSNIDNGYLHEIHPSSLQTPPEQFVSTNWVPFREVRYVNKANHLAESTEVCAVVSGWQSDGQRISKSSCLGDNVSSIPIRARNYNVVDFELIKDKFRDKDGHRAFTYELHTTNSGIEVRNIQYSTGATTATDPIIRVIGNSEYNILQDRRAGNKENSWSGVWAYDPSSVKTVEMINENSKTVGSYDLPPTDPASSLVNVFLLHQIHNKMFMATDLLCDERSATGGGYHCHGYSGQYKWTTPKADILTNLMTITDEYGTNHNLSLNMGSGSDIELGH